MQQTIAYRPFEIHPRLKRPASWIGIALVVIGLSIFQDYLFSRFQNTGFYISESLLYNCIWAFLIPLALLEFKFLELIKPGREFGWVVFIIALSGLLTALHILIFASYFFAVSYVAFSPTHNFSTIFNAALSNQFYILILFYAIVPLFFKKKNGHRTEHSTTEYPTTIKIKVGLRIISLKTKAIETVSTEKPYTIVTLNGKKFLDNRSLKDFETILNPKHFARVHRSAMINKRFVIELKSRKNGDYDAKLQNGQIIRFSRHYRDNWQCILH